MPSQRKSRGALKRRTDDEEDATAESLVAAGSMSKRVRFSLPNEDDVRDTQAARTPSRQASLEALRQTREDEAGLAAARLLSIEACVEAFRLSQLPDSEVTTRQTSVDGTEHNIPCPEELPANAVSESVSPDYSDDLFGEWSNDTNAELEDDEVRRARSTIGRDELFMDHPNATSTLVERRRSAIIQGEEGAVELAKSTASHGLGDRLRPLPSTPAVKNGPQRVWAVRTGWIPAVYDDHSAAKAQVHRYPRSEMKRFEDSLTAEAWMSEPNIDGRKLQPSSNLDRSEWTRFVQRTWLSSNAIPSVDEKADVFPKLQLLFHRASHLKRRDVNWAKHPLPQELVQQERRFAGYNSTDKIEFGLQKAAMVRRVLREASDNTQRGPIPPTRGMQSRGIQALGAAVNHLHCASPSCTIVSFQPTDNEVAKGVGCPAWLCGKCRVRPSIPSQKDMQLPPSPADSDTDTNPIDEEPALSSQQTSVIEMILKGGNVCYVGSAGTGKSTVLRAAVEALRLEGKKVDIIAPSGIAALAVGGQTTFSYGGWVPHSFKKSLDEILEDAKGESIRERLCTTDVLIIDEISMVNSHVFQRLDLCCRKARGEFPTQYGGISPHDDKLPFGGIQVVVTGDFYQLPPVKPFQYCFYCKGDELPGWKHNRQKLPLRCPEGDCNRIYDDDDKWAFRNASWEDCAFECVELTEIWRQQDPLFTKILQRRRLCKPFEDHEKRTLLDHECDVKEAVHLRPTTSEVDAINTTAFEMLDGPVYTYKCMDLFRWNKEDHENLKALGIRKRIESFERLPGQPLFALEEHRYEEELDLKIDTLVILLANLNIKQGLVNGSQGKIVGFQLYGEDGTLEPFDQGRPSRYLPEAVGEHRSLKDLEVKRFATTRKVSAWPTVRFKNGHVQTIYPRCEISERGVHAPYTLLARTQIPLLQAWAITIHKSQGMTLDRAIVDLSKAFEAEMVYVALSRVRTLRGLKVLAIPEGPNRGPNEVVRMFLKKFTIADGVVK